MTPAKVYSERFAAREAHVRRLEVIQHRIGMLRLLFAAVAVVLVWLSWHGRWLSSWWIVIPVAAFVGALVYHAVLRRRHARARRAVAFYQRGLDRVQDRWAGRGNRGERFADAQHVYAADLDLFGDGSLFELVCAVRTRMGEETLAKWLLGPASVAEIRERQTCIRDLRERLDLRERIATQGDSAQPALQPGDLLSWAESAEVFGQAWIRAVAYLLPALMVAALIAVGLTGFWVPVLIVLVVEGAVLQRFKGRLRQVLGPAESAFDRDGLHTFVALLREVEGEKFDSALLRSLAAKFSPDAGRATEQIGRLGTIAMFAEGRRNLIVAALQVPLLYTLHAALAAERWRRAHGSRVRDWLEATGRFEALSCLGQYSFEHPDDPFPEFLQGDAQLRAEGLGHPLLAQSECVRNNVDLSGTARIWLVSGSNMSGKSTLLRAVGVNVVLAMAGAPVRAHRFELVALQVGASIRVNDSLREGASRFYAEITRLRALVELSAHRPPLLFLVDEMLQGTNSHDRRIGAEGLLKALVQAGAIGLVTTHDLALTELEGLDAGVLRNMHFEDHMADGRMRFDYKLRNGVVTRSNGLELIRAIGIDV